MIETLTSTQQTRSGLITRNTWEELGFKCEALESLVPGDLIPMYDGVTELYLTLVVSVDNMDAEGCVLARCISRRYGIEKLQFTCGLIWKI